MKTRIEEKKLADMRKRDRYKMNTKKFTLLLFSLAFLYLSVACDGLKTPEELIYPPEINLERKMIEDTVRRFLPTNSEIIFPKDKQSLRSEPYSNGARVINNIDEEVIALYRDKTSRKLGILSIRRNGETWSKVLDMQLDAFEIADYHIVDLDGDGENEIILGYFSIKDSFKYMMVLAYEDNAISKIYETEYLGFNISNGEIGARDIAFSTMGNDSRNNRFSIINYKNGKISKEEDYIYPENIDIYKISYGKINDELEGYYLDMYVDESTGKTDILSKGKDGLYSLLKDIEVNEISQAIPVASLDINNDGKIELVENKLLQQEDESIIIVQNEYKSISNNKDLVPIVNIIEDHYNNIKIILPPLAKWGIEDRINVNSEKDKINISYYSPEEKRFYKFLEIKIIGIDQDFENSYSLIMERGDSYIVGKKFEIENMPYVERIRLDDFFSSIGVLAEIIKVIE